MWAYDSGQDKEYGNLWIGCRIKKIAIYGKILGA